MITKTIKKRQKMKSKRILFKISGIIKCVVGGGVLFLFGVMLLISGIFKKTLLEDLTMINSALEELKAIDPTSELLTLTPEQFVDYMMNVINIFSIVMIVFSLATITLGIFSLLFVRNYDLWLRHRLGAKILYSVLDCLFSLGLIAKVLAIVAMYIKDKPLDEVIIES